jgi:cell division transport system permease protein
MAEPHVSPAARRPRPRRIAAWREQHAWSLNASMHRLRARRLGTLLTMAVMGFALALPLAFWLLLSNVQRLGSGLNQAQAVTVFMHVDADASAASALAVRLRKDARVAGVDVRTPRQGLDELSSMQGFTKALDALHYNPLPYVLLVRPRADLDAADAHALVKQLQGESGVERVQDDGAWRQRLDAMVAVGTRVVALLAALLALAALLVVGNSVRLDIQGRAEEIEVLQLVGASRAFVRRPYLYAGFWYGLGAGVVAVLLVLALEWAVSGPVTRLAAAYAGRLQFTGLSAPLLLGMPLASAALGWLGARLVTARHLWTRT